MPASYLIDTTQRLVFSRGWGALTDDELHWHANTLRADSRFDPGFRQVVHFLDLGQIRVTIDGVRGLAQINPFRPDSRRAIAAPGDVAFGLTRVFEALTNSDGEQFRVFRSLGPAFEWIGLDPATIWPEQEPDAVIGVSVHR